MAHFKSIWGYLKLNCSILDLHFFDFSNSVWNRPENTPKPSQNHPQTILDPSQNFRIFQKCSSFFENFRTTTTTTTSSSSILVVVERMIFYTDFLYCSYTGWRGWRQLYLYMFDRCFGLLEIILRLICQFWTLGFSIFQNRSETVPKIPPNRPKIIPKASQIRPMFFDVFSPGFLLRFPRIKET